MEGRPRTGRVANANWQRIRVATHDLVPTYTSIVGTTTHLVTEANEATQGLLSKLILAAPPNTLKQRITYRLSSFHGGHWTELLTRSEDAWPLASNTHAPN